MIDTHVHFDSFKTPEELDAVINRAHDAGVTHMMAIGGNEDANMHAIQTAESYPDSIYAAIGYDRYMADSSNDLKKMPEYDRSRVKAIGEIGLDYYYEGDKRTQQIRLFEAMLSVAADWQLPVVIHSRDADEDTLAILKQHREQWKGRDDRIGVLHCYTREKPMAKKLLDLGYMISFSGIITFKKSEPLREVVKMMPMDRLLLETDTPYLAPEPLRGKLNEPANITYIYDKVSELKECTREDVAGIVNRNADTLFGLKK